jgi:hypothetical protein
MLSLAQAKFYSRAFVFHPSFLYNAEHNSAKHFSIYGYIEWAIGGGGADFRGIE